MRCLGLASPGGKIMQIAMGGVGGHQVAAVAVVQLVQCVRQGSSRAEHDVQLKLDTGCGCEGQHYPGCKRMVASMWISGQGSVVKVVVRLQTCGTHSKVPW